MGKRSDFPRRAQDAYDTPPEAVLPLLRRLPATFTYWEPCAGKGALIEALTGGNCVACSDIEPRGLSAWMQQVDAMEITRQDADCFEVEYIITNPPWPQKQGQPTVDLALHLSSIRPTWLLLSADFAHNLYFAKSGLAKRCVEYVSVGRVSWMKNGTGGKENAAWFCFDINHSGPTEYIARAA